MVSHRNGLKFQAGSVATRSKGLLCAGSKGKSTPLQDPGLTRGKDRLGVVGYVNREE